MTEQQHDEIAVRLVEALTGDGEMDAELSAHAFACASCARLVRGLRGLSAEARAAADAHEWAGFDARLKARLGAEAPARRGAATPARRRLRVALPLAAALAALATALWILRPDTTPQPSVTGVPHVAENEPRDAREAEAGATVGGETAAVDVAGEDEGVPAVPAEAWEPEAVVAAADLSSVEAGFSAVGFASSWDVDGTETTQATNAASVMHDGSAQVPAGPAPAWGDVLGELGEELARLDPAQQADLAVALRTAG